MTFVPVGRLLRFALGVALAVAASDAASAQDAPPPRAFGDLVREAQSAFEQKKERPFAAVVAAIEGNFDYDPWIVADSFAASGRSDIARAFAAAGTGPRWTGLDVYLARADVVKARPAEIDLRDAVVEAEGKNDGTRVLDLTEPTAKGSVPTTALALEILLRRADALFDAGRGAETLALARAAGGSAKAIGWVAGQLWASVAEGKGAQNPPQLEVLLASYSRAAELAQRLGNAGEEGSALINVAVVRGMSGDFTSSLVALERAANAYERAPPSSVPIRARAILLMNLGEIRSRMGESAGARVALDRAIEMLRASAGSRADAEEAAILRAALASSCSARLLTGDLAGAQSALREMTESAGAASDADALARAAAVEGRIRFESGEWALALDAFRTARDKFAERSDETLRLRAAASMGYCLRELGRAKEAVDLLRPTVDSLVTLPDPESLPTARRELGEALATLGERDGALQLLRESLAGGLDLGQRDDVVRTRIALAETLLAKGDPAGSLAAASDAAADIPDLVRDTAQTDAAQTRRRWVRCYDAGLRAAVALRDASAVLRFLEAGRAGALLEGLRGRDAFATAAIDPGLLRERAARHRERAGAELALADAVKDGATTLKEIGARRSALAAAASAERDVIARIQRESRAAARVSYPSPVDAATVRADLAPNEALVIFRALPEQTVAAVLTRTEVRFVRLAGAAMWQADAGRLSSAGDEDPKGRAAAATRLRDAVVEPLGLGAAPTRVLVSPDGKLGSVPLCMLFPERAAAFVPSATALHDLRTLPRASGNSVLALGDPDYTREPTLAPLPGTRAEVESLSGPKVTLLGADATRQRFIAELAKGAPWRAVHIACHGVPSEGDPWSSAVVLSAASDAGGRLNALEMAATPFRTDLVTLSACELARGGVVDAEGAIGVPQALLIAGARCVLANLWRADDAAAQLLMKSFYDEWRDGRCGAAEALRIAQARVRSDPRWSESRYWSGWVLWGSAD